MAIAYQHNSVLLCDSIIHRSIFLDLSFEGSIVPYQPSVAVTNTILAANCSVYAQGDLGLFRISHGRGNDVKATPERIPNAQMRVDPNKLNHTGRV